MRKIYAIMAISLLVVSAPAHAVTGVGEMGVEILPNVLHLDKDKAIAFCKDNSGLPNCDIVIADNQRSDMRSVFIAENDNFTAALDKELSGNEYPVRMINFE